MDIVQGIERERERERERDRETERERETDRQTDIQTETERGREKMHKRDVLYKEISTARQKKRWRERQRQ